MRPDDRTLAAWSRRPVPPSSATETSHLSTNTLATAEPIVILARYRGPEHSGNGGYTCGRIASCLEGTVEVTLKKPPPLDRPLEVRRSAEGVELVDGETVIARARPAALDLPVPECPSQAEAAAGMARYQGFSRHAFPGCFVCGTAREPGDGLRIFAGPLSGGSRVAAPWTPGPALADAEGRVRDEFVWAALDCPGAWAWLGQLDNPLVLGRLTLSAEAAVAAGQPHVVAGWQVGRDGRRHYSGTALWTADGRLCARAMATWFEVDEADFKAAAGP